MSDDGTCFENRRAARAALWVRAPLSPLVDAQSDWLTEPGLNPGELHGLAGSTPAASAGHYPTGEGARLIRGYARSDSAVANYGEIAQMVRAPGP